jgi:hypothetical protein
MTGQDTKRWPFNTGDCLIEVIRWAGLAVVHVFIYVQLQAENKIQCMNRVFQ